MRRAPSARHAAKPLYRAGVHKRRDERRARASCGWRFAPTARAPACDARAHAAQDGRGGRAERRGGGVGAGSPPPPSLPYKVDTSRPSLPY